jgi:hypothetical protein
MTMPNIENFINGHVEDLQRLAAKGRLRKSEAKFYVYLWVRHNGDPIYVGKGCGSRAYRRFDVRNNVHLHAIVKKDEDAGFPDPRVFIAKENLTENEAYDLEMRMIAEFKRTKDGGTLANMTDGGPGADVEEQLARRMKALDKFRRMHAANSQQAATFDYEQCLRQCNTDPTSARGVVMKHLFEQPATIEELCERIGDMPERGHRGGQPANAGNVGQALEFIGRRMKRVTRYRLVRSPANVYSIVIQEGE